MSNYAGMKVGAVNRGFGEAQIVQQSLVAEKILKSWTSEHKEEIKKYQAGVMTLKRRSDEINDFIETKGPLSMRERERVESEFNKRADTANRLLKDLVEDYRQTMMKSVPGVNTGTGYTFYDLRGPAYLIYPVNTPLRNSLPRWGKVNAGYGTAVNWKYTSIGPGNGTASQQYAGAQEGQRVGTSLPNENNAIATYAELGVERAVTFTAEFAGEGYTDNVGDEHIRGLQNLQLQEESIIIGGNAGTATGLNGYALGAANTPSTSAAASIPSASQSDGSTAGFTNATSVAVYVIELTMLGYPNNGQYGYQAAPTVGATGLVPSYSRTSAGPYSNSATINGGMGTLSAPSNVTSAITSTPFIKAQVVPKAGAFAWAWFLDDQDATTPSTANGFLAAITTIPVCYFGANSKHTAISGNQAANATGLNSDHSYEALDFSGIIPWCVNNGVFINSSNIGSTDPSTGSAYNGLLQPTEVGTTKIPNIVQLDYDLRAQWNSYQTVADEMWCSADVKSWLNSALLAGGSAAYKFNLERDSQGNILGGFVVSGYKSIYSMKATGAEEIPIRIHPMMPVGTYLLRKTENPYPHSRIPGVAGMFVQRDYYGIEWPLNRRAWEFGTYVHETYGDYIPGLLTMRTGITGVSTT
jgi:hypothetical protein